MIAFAFIGFALSAVVFTALVGVTSLFVGV